MDDGFSHQALHNIAAMRPRDQLEWVQRYATATKTDGLRSRDESTDCDQRRFSSRQRLWPGAGNHDYGVEDTARALIEAQQKGIETFCITVDSLVTTT